MSCSNCAALRQRVEELDREKAALLNSLSLMTESRDTAEAKLARCVEALEKCSHVKCCRCTDAALAAARGE